MLKCKLPGLLSEHGYYEKILRDYYNSNSLNLSKEGLTCLISCIVKNICSIIENPENELENTLNLLLKLSNSFDEKYEVIINYRMHPDDSFFTLIFALRHPKSIVELVKNNYKVYLNPEFNELYEKFIKEITPMCIKEIVDANKVRLHRVSKNVTFAHDTENLLCH